MSYANKNHGMGKVAAILYGLLLILHILLLPTALFAEDEFSFDLKEIEKKPYKIGGFIEFRGEYFDMNQDSIFSSLNADDPDQSNMSLIHTSGQLDGSYEYGISSLHWQLVAAAQQDTIGWSDHTAVNEAYLSLKPAPSSTFNLGKKSYRWGKGYAWNPVGFINRRKDPNNPEDAMEGYITLEGDFIATHQGSLQTTALTLAVLPVWDDVNDDFDQTNEVNVAAKLYLLYMDTDIDLIVLLGDSRSDRIGLDFSTNLAPHFELHGEAVYIPKLEKIVLQEDHTSTLEENSACSGLLGIRYLTENDVTSIVEYYYNEGGYSEDEMSRFYDLAEDGLSQNSTTLLDRAREMSLKGYGRPQTGRQYLYAKMSQKEPFDLLYFTPGVTTLLNLEDQSYSISPEALYTGITNWEFRLRFSLMNGERHTEYGEKMNSNKLELRVRYFF